MRKENMKQLKCPVKHTAYQPTYKEWEKARMDQRAEGED